MSNDNGPAWDETRREQSYGTAKAAKAAAKKAEPEAKAKAESKAPAD